MTKADSGRTKAVLSRAVIEQIEARRLLAFTPLGNGILAEPNEVGAVNSFSMNENGRYVLAGTRSAEVGNVLENNVFINSYNAGNNSVSGGSRLITTDNASFRPDVAMTGTGSFIVTWQSDAISPTGSIIYMDRFTFTGNSTTLGTPIVVSSGTGDANDPHIAVAADQSFVVVWESNSSGDFRIYQQRYDAGGNAVGGITMASDNNTATSPDVQMNADGTYVVVWSSTSGTLAQRYNASGSAVGGVITVATVASSQPVVGVATDGSFVVAWSASESSGSATRNIFGRRYNASGTALGAAFVASSETGGDQQFPQISVSGDGKFTIGWAAASTTPTQYDTVGFAPFAANGTRISDDALIENVAFTVLDEDTPRFGISWQDGLNLTVAYAADSPFGVDFEFDDAVIQKFEGQLNFDLTDTQHTIQLFGTPASVEITDNGVTTSYSLDIFTNIEITTGLADDYIRAKNLAKPIIVNSGGGNDTIIGSNANDTIDAGTGDDVVNGGEGDDYAYGSDGQDTMFGGSGNDTLSGGPGRNLMYGEDGGDLLNGGNRPDTMYGGNGDDRLRGGAGGDALIGGDGADDMRGDAGNDGFVGGNGDDYMFGGGENDTLRGNDGDDTLLGGPDNDYLYGDLGFDFVDGGNTTSAGFFDAQADYAFTDNNDFLLNIEVRRVRANVTSNS